MPLVLVAGRPQLLKQVKNVEEKIAEILADKLNCEPVGLNASEIDFFYFYDDQRLNNLHEFNIAINVFASDFPDRRQNIQDRTEAITKELETVFSSNIKFFVFIRLAHSGYAVGNA